MFESWPFTNFHDLNLDWIIRTIKEWNKRLEEFFEGGGIHDYIEGILEEHPEWVTTVMNGAITEPKIESAFLKEIKNDYVTPEMFGAAGDGVTDDTVAVKTAIDTGKTVYLAKVYRITNTLVLPSNTVIKGAKMYSTLADPHGIILADHCDATHIYAGERFVNLDTFRIIAEDYSAIAFCGSGTITRCSFANLTLDSKYDVTDTYVQQDKVTSDVTLWNMELNNISCYTDATGEKYALYLESPAIGFSVKFDNFVAGDKSVYIQNLSAVFYNSNFGFDNSTTFFTKASAFLKFIDCNFEDDEDGTATKMTIGSARISFTDCSFHSRATNTDNPWWLWASSLVSAIFENCRWSYKTTNNFWTAASNQAVNLGAFKFLGHNNNIPAFSNATQQTTVNSNVGNAVTPYRYDSVNVPTNAFGTFHGRLAYYNGTKWVGDGSQVSWGPPYANTEYDGKLWTDPTTFKTYVWVSGHWYDMNGVQYTG